MRIISLMFLCLPMLLSAQNTDYGKQENWAALPTVKDAADWTPKGLSDQQEKAKADVFFIYPTTKLTGWGSNADIDDRAVNNRTDELSMKFQASVFNGSCRVYAPRYRQASLHMFFKGDSPSSKAAFDKAYSDVKAAFEYYLEHYNNGRPIIIAGHSQGSMHAARLLKEFFDGKPLQDQLVAAYLIGWPVKRTQFKQILVADSATQVGGIISYNTFGTDADPGYIDYRGAICVNPLSWKADPDFVSAKEQKGGINEKWEGIKPTLTGCKCSGGMLQIQKPAASGYIPMMGKNYHLYDYSLFYNDLRINVDDRVKAYLEIHQKN